MTMTADAILTRSWPSSSRAARLHPGEVARVDVFRAPFDEMPHRRGHRDTDGEIGGGAGDDDQETCSATSGHVSASIAGVVTTDWAGTTVA